MFDRDTRAASFAVLLCTALAAVAAKPSLQEEFSNGAKVYYRKSGTIYAKDLKTGSVQQIASGGVGTTKISGDGTRVLSASSSTFKVFDVATGNKVFEKNGMNARSRAGTAAEINWNGSRIYYVTGSSSQTKIWRMDVPGGNSQLVFTSGHAIAYEGEFCMSKDENRFVGRYSNDKAVYVDVSHSNEGKYANECSPCISPDGTRCGVNQNGHVDFKVYNWAQGGGSPSYWKNIDSQVGSWDNHTWSNHDDYVIDHNGKIINVQSGNSWNASISRDDYIDLWVNVGPADEQAPTAPGNLQVVTTGSFSVTLSWDASTDNVGVTGYLLFSGSTQIGSAPGNVTQYEFAGLEPETQYTLTLKATDGSNVSNASNDVSVTTNPIELPIKISFGSSAAQGEFLADAEWTSGALYGWSGSGVRALSASDAVAGTDLDQVYQTLLAGADGGEIEYRVTVPNGACKVTLLFCEFWRDGAGGRSFDVMLEGQTHPDNPIDIAGSVGKATAYDVVGTVTVDDGLLNVLLTNPNSGNEPIISGLIVEQGDMTVSDERGTARSAPDVCVRAGMKLRAHHDGAIGVFRLNGAAAGGARGDAGIDIRHVAAGMLIVETRRADDSRTRRLLLP